MASKLLNVKWKYRARTGMIVGSSMKSLGKIIRSVQAFGRELRISPIHGPDATGAGIGLALGGGFARGIAHVGVLKVLEEENIPIRYIAGTSVGALIGAAYCSGLSPVELEHVATHVRFKHFARWTLSRYGFASNQRMIGFLNQPAESQNLRRIAHSAGGDGHRFFDRRRRRVSFRPADRSGARQLRVPGNVFAGQDSRTSAGGRHVVLRCACHSPLRQMGADRVLAVHLKGKWTNGEGPRHLFDVIGQCFAIAQEMNSSQWRQAADLAIEPDVNGFKYDAFEHSAALVRAGEAVTRAALPEIRKWLQTEPARTVKLPRSASPQPVVMPAD